MKQVLSVCFKTKRCSNMIHILVMKNLANLLFYWLKMQMRLWIGFISSIHADTSLRSLNFPTLEEEWLHLKILKWVDISPDHGKPDFCAGGRTASFGPRKITYFHQEFFSRLWSWASASDVWLTSIVARVVSFRISRLEPGVALCAYLLYERSKGIHSFWEPYLSRQSSGCIFFLLLFLILLSFFFFFSS